MVFLDFGSEKLATVCAQPGEGSGFVRRHKGGVANDIGGKYGR
jgi:hypothetical protein